MKTMTSTLKKIGITVLCIAAMSYNANATVFTAVLSGNYNSSATWGGVIPASLLTSDIIIIPSGITVTLDVSASFSGTSSITVDGALISGSYSTALMVTSGTFSGSGNVSVDSLELGLTSGFSFTGNILAQNVMSLGTNISSATNVTVGNTLMLSSGAMNFTSGSLTMSSGSSITLAGGTLTSSGSGAIYLDSMYDVNYTASYGTTGVELSGSGLRNITVNASGAVTLSSNLSVNGTLTLMSGTLMLNGHNLIFNSGSNFLATGSGMIGGNTSSDISVMSTSSLTGSLMFASGSNTIHNLTINMGSTTSNITLGNSLNLAGSLNLQSGNIKLGSNNLSINAGGSLTGGSANSYVIADGGGSLVMNLTAGNTDSFKIGTTVNYAPMAIKANASSTTGDVGINIMGDVLVNGTTGASIASTKALVKNTWYLTSSAVSGINYDMYAMWNASMEVNGFDRTHAFISHYTGGTWDIQSPSMATASGSMYMISRAGITSLSPFTVADNTFSSGIRSIATANAGIIIYPNPVSNVLYFDINTPVSFAYIYNMSGQLVASGPVVNNCISVSGLPAGLYSIHLSDDNFITDKTFIKN